MAARSDPTPLIVIVGETGSGKSALALELAARFNGEIIAADSRTIYRGLDIGAAKPTAADRSRVPHHLLDVAEPDQSFSAAQFKMLADRAITDIAARGRVPFLVGGTGLYIDSVIYNFGFRSAGDKTVRQELVGLDALALQQKLRERDIPLPNNPQNPRHLIRALETGGAPAVHAPLRPHTSLIGIQVDREVLRHRLVQRTDDMIAHGLVGEARELANRYGWEAPGLQASGYSVLRAYIEGAVPLKDAKALFVQAHLRLAKRQRTWFKRNKSIHWISKQEEAVDLVTTLLSK